MQCYTSLNVQIVQSTEKAVFVIDYTNVAANVAPYSNTSCLLQQKMSSSAICLLQKLNETDHDDDVIHYFGSVVVLFFILS